MKKVKTVTVDSSQRLEQIINELKLDKKTTAWYSHDGRELPLNSSLASHNIDENEILESCSSPVMSALISAVLNDFTEIKSNIPESDRTPERIQTMLRDRVEWDPWPSFSNSEMKSRTICLAMMKIVLQRDDRYANHNIPQCNDLESLYECMQPIWTERGGNNRNNGSLGYNNPGHLFKPMTQKGRPSGVASLSDASNEDGVEAFIKAEEERRNQWLTSLNGIRGNNSESPYRSPPARRRGTSASTPRNPRRPPRTRTQPAHSRKNPPCQCCGQGAEYTCLEDGCVFAKADL